MTGGRRPLVVRALGTVATSAALACALAACSSPKTAAPTTTAGSGGTSGASSTSSASGSTTSAPPGSACAAASLTMTESGLQGAAGTMEATFSMRNASGSPCPMKGYPGALLLSSTGAQLPTLVVPGGSYPFTSFAPQQIVLTSGEAAYFNVGFSDVPHAGESSCPSATQLEITPPGASDHATVAVQFQVCNMGSLTVSPVFIAGGTGSQTTAPGQS